MMDNVRHLYTVLAILGFVSLPVIMNSEKVLSDDIFHAKPADPFAVERMFPLGRRDASTTQPVSPGKVVPATNGGIPQRWIDEPLKLACKRPTEPSTVRKASAESCLIV